jgi:hypothetical protein
MHPIEHLIFFSSILIHFVVAAHPIHILFHMQHQALTAATSHTGFEGLLAGKRILLALGTFHHQMHHRYFECNYGNPASSRSRACSKPPALCCRSWSVRLSRRSTPARDKGMLALVRAVAGRAGRR